MTQFLFWVSIFFIVYAYFGYPVVLISIDGIHRIPFLRKNISNKTKVNFAADENLPFVSFIITAYNEESRIAGKIENSLGQTYPASKLEIIVASDCSTDRTDAIVQSFNGQGVRLVRAPERKGKENAQLHAVKAANGEILVFSDVATIIKSDAIMNIVKNFANPKIGCVSSEDRFIDKDGNVSGEGLYVKYEMFLRKIESKVNTLVGLSGSFFAARKIVCENWAPDLQSDFNTLLNSVKLGLKGVTDPDSIGYYKNIVDEKKEFQRKVRTVLRGITVLMRNLHLMNPKQFGFFAFQLFSHKMCRWLVPIFMVVFFITNLFLLNNGSPYIFLFILQMVMYGSAVHYFFSNLFKKRKKESTNTVSPEGNIDSRLYFLNSFYWRISRIMFYFLTVNVSILLAWIKFISGNRTTFWEPSKR